MNIPELTYQAYNILPGSEWYSKDIFYTEHPEIYQWKNCEEVAWLWKNYPTYMSKEWNYWEGIGAIKFAQHEAIQDSSSEKIFMKSKSISIKEIFSLLLKKRTNYICKWTNQPIETGGTWWRRCRWKFNIFFKKDSHLRETFWKHGTFYIKVPRLFYYLMKFVYGIE